jgi:hypothetical protein
MAGRRRCVRHLRYPLTGLYNLRHFREWLDRVRRDGYDDRLDVNHKTDRGGSVRTPEAGWR